MHTLRVSLAGAAILALLGGMGAVTLAQSDSDAQESAESAPLSFTMPYASQTASGLIEFLEGRIRYPDNAFRNPFEANDPRLRGELWSIHSWDTYEDSQGSVIVGRAGIDHESGAWQGTFHGYASPNDEHLYYQLDLNGEGAYEGLSAMLFIIDNGTSFDVEGMVFSGELPPMPEPPAE
jgi:hypothetical protein